MLPYYFFRQKLCCIGVFLLVFQCFFVKNRKKSSNFLQFFLSVYQQVRRNLKKKLLKSLDRILKCCIFAACLRFNRNNKSK